jgi:hypothetical protein
LQLALGTGSGREVSACSFKLGLRCLRASKQYLAEFGEQHAACPTLEQVDAQ